MSNASGKYFFEKTNNGSYLVTATFSGMRPFYTQPFEITPERNEPTVETIYLKNLGIELKNVAVAVTKPMFKQKIDRLVIIVKNSISDAGGTALDVLEKSWE